MQHSYLQPIEKLLADTELYISQVCNQEPMPICEVISYALSGGGKRIRPALFLLCACALGSKRDDLHKLACAIELFHTASLIHDDIVDNSNKRRWRDSVNAKWGNAVGVLTGDALWQKALSIVINCGDVMIMREANSSIDKIIRTELSDALESKSLVMNEENYMRMIDGKTAELFSFAGKAAAICAEADAEMKGVCAGIGFHVGIAFQLQDDASDYRCSESETGKPRCQDLSSGKVTFPLIAAAKKMDDEKREKIFAIFSASTISESETMFILDEVLNRSGVNETYKLAEQHLNKAADLARSLPSSKYSDCIISLIDSRRQGF